MNQENDSSHYWRSKLSAFMHDPVSKALDVRSHEQRAFEQRAIDAINDEERFAKDADWAAAAADRLPFPNAGAMTARFDGRENPFKHPLDGRTTYTTPAPLTADEADTHAQGNRPYLEESDPRSDFIARWRFWRMWAQERHPALAFLPADTRIPDHSIWHHLGLTSALQGCFEHDSGHKPALLLFSIGPVQPLIAAARRIGDLWSGSYLLSYLISTALGDIAREYGPDHILFPSAWGQPLLDLQLKDIYENAKVREADEDTLWNQLWRDNPRNRQRYLLPSLPNRFLALLPASEAKEQATRLEKTVRAKLREIGESVDQMLEIKLRRDGAEKNYLPERITPQLDNTLEVHWQTLDLPKTPEEAEEWGRKHLPDDPNGQAHPAMRSLANLRSMWASLPNGSRTGYGMRTGTVAWPAVFSLLSWALDAAKQTRLFDAWCESSRWDRGAAQNKDNLTGKEEAVFTAPPDEAEAKKLGGKIAGSQAMFRPNERLGALTLVKRLWHLAYLKERYGFKEEDFRMPDTHQLAQHQPFPTHEGTGEEADDSDEAGYMAVLALDGDEMGQWISGKKTPPLRDQLAAEARGYFEEKGLGGENRETPAHISAADFLDTPRPLNPSFHLQFSEALANFGLFTARRIVEAHDGRLLYAGGDDVLALLPADNALACARALRAAFRGESDDLGNLRRTWQSEGGPLTPRDDQRLFATQAEGAQSGFIRLHPDLRKGGALRGEPLYHDVLVPGPRAEVSCGIAVGHAKSPLQDLVQAAQEAEKHAKNNYGRFAFALSIYKRSGEIVHWGAKWADPNADDPEKEDASAHTRPSAALAFFEALLSALRDGDLSKGFPHKWIALIEPYVDRRATSAGNEPESDTSLRTFAADAGSILARELAHCLEQSGYPKGNPELESAFAAYWEKLGLLFGDNTQRKLHDLVALLQAFGWIARQDTAEPREDAPGTPAPATT